MYFAIFLHLYQPPGQSKKILDRIVDESYRKVLNGLLQNPRGKITLNINAGLTEMFEKEGYSDLIDNLKTLLSRGQIELTESAKYHALLPRLPASEVKRQIEINHQTHLNYFGQIYNPQGFFPPEMGYSPDLGRQIKEMGYKWIILDEIALDEPLDQSSLYRREDGLSLFFRKRDISFQILSGNFKTASSLSQKLLSQYQDNNSYAIAGMDGETFGHHRVGLETLLTETYNDPSITLVSISELLNLVTKSKTVTPIASNWAMSATDKKNNLPFARWDSPDNLIHQKQWQLVDLALKTASKTSGAVRNLLDSSLHSDQFWWASARPWWSLEMIERGAHELVQVVNTSPVSTHEDKDQAGALYYEIVTSGFNLQRSGKIDEMSDKENEEIQALISQNKPFVTDEEYNVLIENSRREMLLASQNLEFTRAQELKNRLDELTRERDNLPSHVEVKPNQ